MKLYLVRHGETDWNKVKKIQGQVDIPLNQFGKHLAEETAEGLHDIQFDLCISSPLSRAYETARIILEGRDVPIITDARIGEMAFGEYEGKCCARDHWELPEDFQKFFDDPVGFRPGKGGESFADVRKRTGEFLESLYKKAEGVYGNILITTHGAALAGILNNIRKEPLEKYWGIGVHSNCAVTEVEVKNAEAKCQNNRSQCLRKKEVTNSLPCCSSHRFCCFQNTRINFQQTVLHQSCQIWTDVNNKWYQRCRTSNRSSNNCSCQWHDCYKKDYKWNASYNVNVDTYDIVENPILCKSALATKHKDQCQNDSYDGSDDQ